jgi:hypothetical protein
MSTKKSQGKKTYINEVASVLRGDNGNYIKFNKDANLPAGAKLFITPMSEHIEGLVKRGVITEEEGERRMANFSEGGKLDFILSTVTAVIG